MSPKERSPEGERLSKALRTYVTEGENAVIKTLAPKYGGSARLVRIALASLVKAKHPELLDGLRADIK